MKHEKLLRELLIGIPLLLFMISKHDHSNAFMIMGALTLIYGVFFSKIMANSQQSQEFRYVMIGMSFLIVSSNFSGIIEFFFSIVGIGFVIVTLFMHFKRA